MTLRIDDDLLARLTELAEQAGMSRSDYVRAILVDFLEGWPLKAPEEVM